MKKKTDGTADKRKPAVKTESTETAVDATSATARSNGATDQETHVPAPVAEIQRFTQEAWEWMTDEQSIPGAFSPLLYIGMEKSLDLAIASGRPLELNEAMLLVQADGEMATCSVTGVQFQAVKYLAYVPRNLKNVLDSGVELVNVRFVFGGQYYVDKERKNIVPISGSCYHVIRDNRIGHNRESVVMFNYDSPLTKIQKQFGEWAKPLADVKRIINAKVERTKRNARIEELSQKLGHFAPQYKQTRMSRVSEAFEEAKPMRCTERPPRKEGRNRRRDHAKATE